MPKFNIVDHSGSRAEINVEVEDYRAAGEEGLTLSQYLNNKFQPDMRHGSTFEQCLQQSGMFIRPDRDSGIRPPSMKQVLEGGLQFNAGAIVRNDGSQNNTVSGRLLFPEVILQIIESELRESKDDLLRGYDQMVATTAFVTSPKVDQPIINVTAPLDDEYRSQPIAQLTEPAALITITVGEKSYRIPTKSIGLTISDQALEATTLDLVGIAMTQQARQERIRIVEDSITGMLTGDTDADPSDASGAAANTFTAKSLDTTGITADGTITQKAWVHFLRDSYRTMTVTDIMCDIDTALALEGRTGRPTMYGIGNGTSLSDDPSSPRIDALFTIENLAMVSPRILLLDTALIGANTVVGIDRNYAIRRLVNVNASYQAIENYVMRRATSFRVDYGENAHRLMTDAWKHMTLTVA